MYNVNPMELIKQIRGGANPQQLLMGILENNMKNTPMGENLIQLAKEGKSQDIEKIARNLCEQRGLNFDEEFKAFKNHIGLE